MSACLDLAEELQEPTAEAFKIDIWGPKIAQLKRKIIFQTSIFGSMLVFAVRGVDVRLSGMTFGSCWPLQRCGNLVTIRAGDYESHAFLRFIALVTLV